MRTLLGFSTAFVAAGLSAFGQTPAPSAPQRAHSANAVTTPETPYLGVGGQDVTSDRAKTLKLKEERGVEVTSVDPEGSAAKAGVKEGDVVLEFNGQKVEGWEHLKRLVRETPIHRDVKVVVSRNGALQTLTANIGSRKEYETGGWMVQPAAPNTWMQTMPPSAPMPPAANMPPMGSMFDMPMFRTLMGSSSLGIVGESLGQDSQLAEFFGVKDGVLVRTVNKDSAAEKAGMKAGDVITKIDDTAISSPQQIASALRSARSRNSVNIVVVRNKKEMTLTVTPDANGMYRGGMWDPKENILLELFQPAGKDK